jgi:hypothetical protein
VRTSAADGPLSNYSTRRMLIEAAERARGPIPYRLVQSDVGLVPAMQLVRTRNRYVSGMQVRPLAGSHDGGGVGEICGSWIQIVSDRDHSG